MFLPPALSCGVAVIGLCASLVMGSMGLSNLQDEVIINYEKGNWIHGQYKEFDFEAKVYDEPSKYGINGGKVSKFLLKDKAGTWRINYDRGWDVVPDEEIEHEALNVIITELER